VNGDGDQGEFRHARRERRGRFCLG